MVNKGSIGVNLVIALEEDEENSEKSYIDQRQAQVRPV